MYQINGVLEPEGAGAMEVSLWLFPQGWESQSALVLISVFFGALQLYYTNRHCTAPTRSLELGRPWDMK